MFVVWNGRILVPLWKTADIMMHIAAASWADCGCGKIIHNQSAVFLYHNKMGKPLQGNSGQI